MYDSVLIPTDGSEPARRAAGYGVALAESYGATVHVLSVVDERDFSTDVLDGEDLVAEGKESAEREAQRAVEAVTDLVSGVDVSTHVESGVSAEEILETAETADVDVTVMGTHGRTGLERFVIGSVTERVVRLASIPVLTVRPREFAPTWPPERVLFPTDGSDASFSALPFALELAERFDAVVEGLYVIDERMKSSYYTAETVLEDVVGGLRTAGERATARVETGAADRGVAVETSVVEGLPPEAVCTHADDSGADVVVMSTHGRTGLEHFFLGSVTERVVRNAPVPVLTTPVRDEDGEESD